MRKPIDLIYILSSGHSGSTLIDLMLGSHSCIESVGEIDKFSEYFSNSQNTIASKKVKLCNCGQPIAECSYWKQVKEKLDNSIVSNINLKQDFAERNYQLMSAILAVSGKKIICDSSKQIDRLSSFLASDLFNVQIIHLIRDGRAYAFSMKNKQERTIAKYGSLDKYKEFLRAKGKQDQHYNYDNAIKKWNEINIAWQKQFNKLPNYYFLKYENLVENPEKSLSAILKKVDLKFESNQVEFYKVTHHNIDGNRMRMKGSQEIKRDTRYLENLSFKDWWLGTALAWQGLVEFKYPITRE